MCTAAEYFHSSASPHSLLLPVPPHLVAGNICLASEWSPCCRLEQVEEHIVAWLMMRVSALSPSLLEETQAGAAAARLLTPLVRPGKQISKHMHRVFFNPVEHFGCRQTQITLRDVHILDKGVGAQRNRLFLFFLFLCDCFCFFSPPKVTRRAHHHPGSQFARLQFDKVSR